MRLVINLTAKLLLTACLALSLLARDEPRIRVLIVDGINNHDWVAATKSVQKFLDRTGRFSVEVSTSPAVDAGVDAWNRWHPQFGSYQVVILNFNSGHKPDSLSWPPALEHHFEQYVRNGGGLVVLHAANNSFPNWKAFNDMIGLGWRDRDFGPGLAVKDDGTVVRVPQGTGLNPGHGPRHDFAVHVLNPNHPITKGMPPVWMHPSEQLTHGQHGPAEGLTILTYAKSDVSGQNEPMDWVRTYGKGRVYTTMLGHTWANEPSPDMNCAGFQTLFSRGVEWAATGQVTIPIPADFPTATEMSVRRE